MNDIANIANEFAKSINFDYADFVEQKNGYDVYVACFDTDEVLTIGLPIFILVKDGVAREATGDEMWQIMGNAK